MASNISSGIKEIEGLKGINRKATEDQLMEMYANSPEAKERLSQPANILRSGYDYDFDMVGKTKRVFGEPIQYGASFWDSENPMMNPSMDAIQDQRAENQWELAKAARAPISFAATTASTVAQTIGVPASIITGAYDAITGDDLDWWTRFQRGFVDNPVQRGISAIEEFKDEALPIYKTTEQESSAWFAPCNLFSGAVIDEIGSTMGFMAGAMITGAPVANVFSTVAGGYAGLAARVAGSTASATVESLTEARGVLEEARNSYSQEIADRFDSDLNELYNDYADIQKIINQAQIDIAMAEQAKNNPEASRIYMPGYFEEMQKMIADNQAAQSIIESKIREKASERDKAIQDSETAAIKAAWVDFILTEAILVPMDFGSVGQIYAGAYGDARRSIASSIIRDKVSGKFAYKDAGKWMSAGGAILNESAQEVAQGVANVWSQNAYRGDALNLYKTANDVDINTTFANTLGSSLGEALGDPETWKEAAMVAVTMGLAAPRIRSARKKYTETVADKETGKVSTVEKTKWQSPLYFDFFMKEHRGQYESEKKYGNTVADYLNTHAGSPDFEARWKAAVAHNFYREELERAAAAGDRAGYEDARIAQLVNDLIYFDNAGQLDMIKNIIDQADKLNDSEIEKIIKATTRIGDDNKLYGPFKDYATIHDGKVASTASSAESKAKISQKIEENKKGFKKIVDSYIKAKNDIQSKSGLQASDDDIATMTYLKVGYEYLKGQADDLMKANDTKEALRYVLSNIEKKRDFLANKDDEASKKAHKRYSDTAELLQNMLNNSGFESLFPFVLNKEAQGLFFNQNDRYKPVNDDIRSANEMYGNAIKMLADYNSIYTGQRKLEEERKKFQKEQEAKEKKKKTQSNTEKLKEKKVSELRKEKAKGTFDGKDIDDEQLDDEMKAKLDAIASLERAARGTEFNHAFKEEELDDLFNTGDKGLDDLYLELADRINQEQIARAEDPTELLKRVETDDELFNNPYYLLSEADRVYLSEAYELKAIEEYNEFLKAQLGDIAGAIELARLKYIEAVEELLNRNPNETYPNTTAGTTTGTGSEGSVGNDSTTKGQPTQGGQSNVKEEPTPLPDGKDEVHSQASSSVVDESQTGRGYWFSPTSRYVYGNKKGVPASAENLYGDKTWKAVYTYLTTSGAFDRQERGDVKPGEKVKFGFDLKLNNDCGTPILLMFNDKGECIGNLPAPKSAAKQEGMTEFIKLVTDEFNKAKSDLPASTEVWFSQYESQVLDQLIGFVPYMEDDLVCNTIASVVDGEAKFNIWTGVTERNPTGYKKLPRPHSANNFKKGQPVLLFPTMEGQQPVAVPFYMPTMDMINDSHKMYGIIKKGVQKLLDATKKEDVEAAALELKDVLLAGWIEKRADGTIIMTDTYGNNILSYRPTSVDDFMTQLQDKKVRLNAKIGSKEMEAAISEIGLTPVLSGYNRTLNNRFTIKPMDAKGKMMDGKHIARDTSRINPTDRIIVIRHGSKFDGCYIDNVENAEDWQIFDEYGRDVLSVRPNEAIDYYKTLAQVYAMKFLTNRTPWGTITNNYNEITWTPFGNSKIADAAEAAQQVQQAQVEEAAKQINQLLEAQQGLEEQQNKEVLDAVLNAITASGITVHLEDNISGDVDGAANLNGSKVGVGNTVSNSSSNKTKTNEIRQGQEAVKLKRFSTGEFNVNPETMEGVILTDGQGHSIFTAMGRTFVLCNVNGTVVPFYQSSHGTSGKKRGAWYPFFGYTGNWLIKGTVDTEGKMHYSLGIERITELLNKDFKIPTDFSSEGISRSTNLTVEDFGLKMYSVYDRFGKEMQELRIIGADILAFYDRDLEEVTNANALFVKEVTGLKTKGIHSSHYAYENIMEVIEDTENQDEVKRVAESNKKRLVDIITTISQGNDFYSKLAKMFLDNDAIPSHMKFLKINNNRDDIEWIKGFAHPEVGLLDVAGNNVSKEEFEKAILFELIRYVIYDTLNISNKLTDEQNQTIVNVFDYIEKNRGGKDSYAVDEFKENELDEALKSLTVLMPKVFDLLKDVNGKQTSNPNIEYLRDSNGIVYGYVKDGEIYLNKSALNPEAPVHEYTHLWDKYIQIVNPKLWKSGVELLKQTDIWDEVINDKNYDNIKDNEDLVASEVHSRLTGKEATKLFNRINEQNNGKGLLDKIKTWLNNFKRTIIKALGANGANVENLTLEQFNKLPIRDLFLHTDILSEIKMVEEQAEQKAQASVQTNDSQVQDDSQQDTYSTNSSEEASEVKDDSTQPLEDDEDGPFANRPDRNKIKSRRPDLKALNDNSRVVRNPTNPDLHWSDSPLRRAKTSKDSKHKVSDAEKTWLKEHLPQLSNEDRLRIVTSLEKALQSDSPLDAWGTFYNGIMFLSEDASRGTLYHESFHAVTRLLLNDSDKSALFAAAKAKYGELSELELEEKMAEDFRRYMQLLETPIIGSVAKIFRNIKRWIDRFFNNKDVINNLFWNISNGEFKHKPLNDTAIETAEIRRYHNDKLSIEKLDKESLEYLHERGVTKEDYESWTDYERAAMLACK